MKRKWLARILSLILVLGLLPFPALAADDYWIQMSAGDARQMLAAVADGSETRRIVFVYYGADAASQTAAKQFSDYAGKNGCYIYYHPRSGGEDLSDALAPLFGNSAPAVLPAAVTYNPTKGYLAKENVSTLMTAGDVNGLLSMMMESGIQNGGSTPSGPSSGDEPAAPDYKGTSGCSIPGVGSYEWEVLRLVNQYRMTGHVQPLSVFAGLQAAAELRARELPAYLSHNRPDGSGYETAFQGIPWNTHSENIASGQENPASVFYAWLHSEGHRKNIERGNKLHLGIGYHVQNPDTTYGYQRYWAQNFLSDRNCVLYNMKLSRTSIPGGGYSNLEDLLQAADVEVTMTCPVHGPCSMPLIAGMCSGYSPNASGNQELTVTYEDFQGVRLTAKLTVTTDSFDSVKEVEEQHVHSWVETSKKAADCTEDGIIAYTCSCGESRVETSSPAKGHTFVVKEDGGTYHCESCDAEISSVLKEAYQDLRSKTNWTFSGGSDEEIQSFLEEQIREVLNAHDAENYPFTIVRTGNLIDAYRYRVEFQAPKEVPGGPGSGEDENPEVPGESSSGEDTEGSGEEEDNSEALEKQLLLSAARDGDDKPVLVTEILTLPLAELTAAESDPSDPPATPSYTVSVSASPAAGGRVSGGGSYHQNASATVAASANQGYRFVRWTEGGSTASTAASYTFTVTAARTLIAEFAVEGGTSNPPAPSTYPPVVKQPGEGGTVSVTPARPKSGDSVKIQLHPDDGYKLDAITITDPNGRPVSITANPEGSYVFIQPSGSVTVEVRYKLVKEEDPKPPVTPSSYTISVLATPPEGGSASGGGSYEENTSATVTAEANPCYRFVRWEEDGNTVSTAISYTFTVTAERTLAAEFAAIDHAYPPAVKQPELGGTVSVVPHDPAEGNHVTIYLHPDDGYELDTITITDPNGRHVSVTANSDGTYTFIQPNEIVTVEVRYKPVREEDPKPPVTPSYSVSVSANPTAGGSVTGGGSFHENTTVTVTAAANSNYHFVRWTENGNTVSTNVRYMFTVSADRALTAEFACVPPSSSGSSGGSGGSRGHSSTGIIRPVKKPAEVSPEAPAQTAWQTPFTDVPESMWCYEAVRFVSVNGLMNGYSSSSFGPNNRLSRAQLAQILYRKEGSPSAAGGNTFTDVTSGSWCASAIAWASAKGIVSGYSNGTFRPDSSITREQLAVMLWRYAGSPVAVNQEPSFGDAGKISGYARDAICWAAENHILSGYGNGELGPQGLVTRAQAAQVLKNFMESQ